MLPTSKPHHFQAQTQTPLTSFFSPAPPNTPGKQLRISHTRMPNLTPLHTSRNANTSPPTTTTTAHHNRTFGIPRSRTKSTTKSLGRYSKLTHLPDGPGNLYAYFQTGNTSMRTSGLGIGGGRVGDDFEEAGFLMAREDVDVDLVTDDGGVEPTAVVSVCIYGWMG